MKVAKFSALFLLIVLLSCVQEPGNRLQELDNRLREEEVVLSRALILRSWALETATKIKFDKVPSAKLERLDYGRGQQYAGQYRSETEKIIFSVSIWYDLNVRLAKSLRLATPQEVAADEDFQILADHELGHALADQVSRRSDHGPWFLPEKMLELKQTEALGLHVVAEGVGIWFAQALHPSRERYSAQNFPSNPEESRFYTFEDIVHYGGYWLVRDILNKYGERGLVWLMSHPLTLNGDNMRLAVIACRECALTELAQSKRPAH